MTNNLTITINRSQNRKTFASLALQAIKKKHSPAGWKKTIALFMGKRLAKKADGRTIYIFPDGSRMFVMNRGTHTSFSDFA